nr:TAXI family TRAP transporter solute-binding subunit [Kiloniellales bacterium]
ATDIGGRTVFKLMGIEADFINIDTQLALEKMKTGEVAATSLLAGAPVKGYKDLLAEQGLHFIGVDPSDPRYAKLLEVYLPASLKHEDYPGLIPQGETVPTVASGAVLAVYNWPKNTPQYRKLARFVRKFFDNFEKFRKEPRHPKWRDINLAAEVPGWTRFKPAEEWLATNTKAPESELKTAFNRFLTSFQQSSGVRNISDQQKDQLFEEFVRWYNTQQ